MSRFAQIVLFLSSYSPLFVVLGILQTFGSGFGSYACYLAAVLSILALYAFLRSAKKQAPQTISINRAEQRDSDAIGYMVQYLLPFLALSTTSGRDLVALGIVFAVVAVLYIRAQLFYVNPILSIVGYRLFRVETSSGRALILISKRKYVAPSSDVSASTLTDYVFLERL